VALPAHPSFAGAATSLANPPWTEIGAHAPKTDGSGDLNVDSAASDNFAVWNADSFADDQTCSLTCDANLGGNGNNYVGLAVRSDLASTSTGSLYWAWCDGGSDTALNKVVGGTFTTLGTANGTALGVGDVLTLEAVGTAITLKVNGTNVISVTDASIASGAPGVYLYATGGAGFSKISDWVGDDFGGGGGGGSPHTVTLRGNVALSSPSRLSIALSGSIFPSVTVGEAEPPNYYHIGMVSWGDSNGTFKAYPVTRLLDQVELPTGMTILYYEFAPGVTAVITEL